MAFSALVPLGKDPEAGAESQLQVQVLAASIVKLTGTWHTVTEEGHIHKGAIHDRTHLPALRYVAADG